MDVKFLYTSRGPTNLVKRALQISGRFGLGTGRSQKRFGRFLDLLDRYGVSPTFPVTALPLSRHPELASMLLDRGAELAVHAYTHVDLSALEHSRQAENIGRAVTIFRRLGIPFHGFRAPYLRWNEDTMRVVEEYGFRYSSNQAVWWSVLAEHDLSLAEREGMERGRAFYRPRSAESAFVLPYRKRGFVEIPVTLPDDEILFDRMYLRDPSRLAEVWRRIAEESYRRGEIFTVQLHPERIDFFSEALSEVLDFARHRRPGVWMTTLASIARWWMEKAGNCASFAGGDGVVRVNVEVAEGTEVLIREGGRERVVEEGVIEIPGDKLPCVGAGPGCERAIVQLLRDKGYLVEIGEEPELFAIHIGELRSAQIEEIDPVLKKLESFPGPLVRFSPWPHGNRSALAVTGDIDAVTLWDFLKRFTGR